MAVLEIDVDTVLVSPVRKRRRVGVLFLAAVGWIVLIGLAAALAGALPIASPTDMDMLARRAPPGAEHLLGTDQLGRDEFSRLIYGARISLTVGLLAPVIGVLIGGSLGMLAGYFRGRFESLTVGGVDVLLAFPPLVFALAVTAYSVSRCSTSPWSIGVLGIPAFTRVARAVTLSLSEREFVVAARALGATHARILLRELLPNVALPLLAFFLLGVAVTIVVEGALSFLGLGVPPPAPSWGSMIGEGRESLDIAPWLAFLPAGFHVPERAGLQHRRRHAARADRSEAGGAVTAPLSVGRGRIGRAADAARRAAGRRQGRPRLAPGTHARRRGQSGCGKTMLSRAILQLLPKRARLSGRGDVRRPRPRLAPAGSAAQVARARARRGLPGPDDLAQSRTHHRHADRRDAAGPSRHRTRRRRRGAASSCWRRSASRRRARAATVSAPALRRHAPARGDRHRARLRAAGC